MVVVTNPVQAAHELAQYLGVTLKKEYMSVGDMRVPLFKCKVGLLNYNVESPALSTKDGALLSACTSLFDRLPFSVVPDDCVSVTGEAHRRSFSASFKTLKTPSFTKAKDAEKCLMQMVVVQYLGVEGLSLSTLSLSENSIDFQLSQIKTSLEKWQEKSLPRISKIIQVDIVGSRSSKQLRAYLTAAFILPGFCQSIDEREAVSKFLGINESSNDRLETIGDAIIGQASALKFFNKGETPGEITLHRSELVNAASLARFVTDAGLDEFVICRDKFQGLSTKVLSDVFEAMVGAVYIADPYIRELCGDHFLNLIPHP